MSMAIGYIPAVDSSLHAIDVSLALLRVVFLWGAVAMGVLCAVDWAARTRRLSPFSWAARTTRGIMSPFIKRVERSVVRAGGNPVSAPWWTLAAIVVIGIVLLQLLEFLRGEIANVYAAVNGGARGVLRLIVQWAFAFFYIALFVRVVSSWLTVNPFGKAVRWSYVVTEPVLAPIRRVLPHFAMLDLSPLVAYLFLSWILQPLVLRLF
jgi:YggT family protein